MIDELEIQKYDGMFKVKSKVFSLTDRIVVETPLDDWLIEITDKKYKNICLLHKNKRGRRDKYHIQGYKNSLFDTYHSIYTHRKWLQVLKESKNTYSNKGNNK